MPKISVILPIYNAAQTLSQTLGSLCRQRFDGFELIAVNDGSQDGTHEILNAYAKRDSRIRIVQSEWVRLIQDMHKQTAPISPGWMPMTLFIQIDCVSNTNSWMLTPTLPW